MLIELIDKYYQKKREEKDQHSFYVTDAGRCPRAIFFSMKGFPRKEKEPKLLRILDRGEMIHQGLMRSLFESPDIRVVAAEISIPPNSIVKGRADAIVSVENKLYVVEIKSIASPKYSNPEIPKKAHRYQIQLYLHFFEIEKGILIYENKNTQELMEFEEKYDKKLCEKILEDFKTLKYHIENDILPPKPKDLEPWQCEYCDFKEVCQKIENEKKIF